MTQRPKISTALMAGALTLTLAACGTTSESSEPPQDATNAAESSPAAGTAADAATSETQDSADSAAPADSVQLADGSDGRPPFPELGTFDPNITGEDMPDPCAWATPEIMAEFGYDKFDGAETMNSSRMCSYVLAEAEGLDQLRMVTISFNNFSGRQAGFEADSKVEGAYLYESPMFEEMTSAGVETKAGGFEVTVDRFDRDSSERGKEALAILESVIVKEK